MDALRRSLKSRGPSLDLDPQEQLPILSGCPDPAGDGADAYHRPEFVVNVDGNSRDLGSHTSGNNSRVWRDSSYEFWKDGGAPNGGGDGAGFSFPQQQQHGAMVDTGEDPPSKLISAFLHKQKASGADLSLDMDLEMEELGKPPTPPAPSSALNSKELRVSFQEPSAESLRRRSSSYNGSSSDSDTGDRSKHGSGGDGEGEAEVLKCSSNSSFRRASGLLRTKTKSRLMDPPPFPSGGLACGVNDRRSQASPAAPRSGVLKSAALGGKPPQQQHDEDDDDPFADEDVPAEYRRAKLNTLTMLQWVSLFLILAALVCSLTIPFFERQTVWNLHLWKWELLVLVLICGRLLSGWAIRIVVFFFESNFLLRKRVLYFVYGVRKAVQNCLWLGLVLIAWHYILDKKVARETNSKTLPYVTKVLICLLVATLLWLGKTLLVKVLASSFHVTTYFDRIQEALFNQYVIETLSGPPLVEIQHIREEEEQVIAEVQKLQNAGATISPELRAAAMQSKSGRVIGGAGGKGASPRTPPVGKSGMFSGLVGGKEPGRQQDEGITIEHLHRLNQKNVSAWNMKRLMNIVRHRSLTTLDEHLCDATGEDESATQIRSEYQAKAAAKKIFTNVARPGSKYIYLVDLMRFMREDEALKTMSLFEGAQESKRVSRCSLKNWVVNAFRERRALSLTLNDTKTAVNKLHQMVNVVVAIVVLVMWLLILGIATTHLLVFISSQILLVVFVFGNTCKMIFEAIIFLFAMHPFDVGDRCEVDGVQMIVEEMNILTTVFLRYDNQKIVYPNSVLSTKPISNYYRSPDMGDSIDFCIHVATPVEKVAIMKERIKAYIDGRKEHWYPSPMVVLRDVEDMNRLKVSVWLQHRMNHQDMGERWTRRELVVEEMIKVFRELDIEYRMLPLDVNIRNMPPASSSSRLPSTWTVCS